MTYNWLISDWIHWGPLERIEPAQQSWLCCNCFTPAGLTPNPLVPGPGRFFRSGHERQIMGKVQGNWITGAHSGRGSSGRACKHRKHLHQDQQENGCVLLREALQPMYTTIKKGNIRQKKQGYRPCFVRSTPLYSSDSRGARTHDPNIKSVVLYQLS